MDLSKMRAIIASHLDPKTGLRHHSAIHRAVEAWALAGFPGEGWTETVPTEMGRYLVVEPDVDVELWRLDDDPTGDQTPWVSPWDDRYRAESFEPGTLFLLCPTTPRRGSP